MKSNLMQCGVGLVVMFASIESFAGTGPCSEFAADAASADAGKKASDDCFAQFTHPSDDDDNLTYVGIACDHTRSYFYKVTTENTQGCKVTKMNSQAIEFSIE